MDDHVQLGYELITLCRDEPFVSKKGSVTTIRQFLVRLQWAGRTGLGTALIADDYDMREASVRAALEECANVFSRVFGFRPSELLDRCEASVRGQTSAMAAVDMALHDLLGQFVGLPLYRLFGLAGGSIGPSSLALGMMEEDERVDRARQLAKWPILKLKMSANCNLDIVARIREVYNGRLWIDGNGAWDADQAIAAANRFHRYRVELLEQPVPAGNPEILRFVRERSPVAIVADEDCMGIEEVRRLEGCADVINIKLLKCGGLRRAIEMIRLARKLGLKIMLGCKIESSIGITAMAHLAELADYLDLDGHYGLRDDPYVGISLNCGRFALPGSPGLGVTASPRLGLHELRTS